MHTVSFVPFPKTTLELAETKGSWHISLPPSLTFTSSSLTVCSRDSPTETARWAWPLTGSDEAQPSISGEFLSCPKTSGPLQVTLLCQSPHHCHLGQPWTHLGYFSLPSAGFTGKYHQAQLMHLECHLCQQSSVLVPEQQLFPSQQKQTLFHYRLWGW